MKNNKNISIMEMVFIRKEKFKIIIKITKYFKYNQKKCKKYLILNQNILQA
jgi:hypothetical protein